MPPYLKWIEERFPKPSITVQFRAGVPPNLEAATWPRNHADHAHHAIGPEPVHDVMMDMIFGSGHEPVLLKKSKRGANPDLARPKAKARHPIMCIMSIMQGR